MMLMGKVGHRERWDSEENITTATFLKMAEKDNKQPLSLLIWQHLSKAFYFFHLSKKYLFLEDLGIYGARRFRFRFALDSESGGGLVLQFVIWRGLSTPGNLPANTWNASLLLHFQRCLAAAAGRAGASGWPAVWPGRLAARVPHAASHSLWVQGWRVSTAWAGTDPLSQGRDVTNGWS